ncbi:hypothetical protein HOLleu_29105 [Holothuria leucospilota]|uniref:Uncharacterized protein n=1 Tax=Holothuria leucospilota TaxID=206669 RepID=A0A9Q1BMU8_HOLLE|nr:hypothetical protein HOLleu_29105 [Holothuria leucospilota]
MKINRLTLAVCIVRHHFYVRHINSLLRFQEVDAAKSDSVFSGRCLNIFVLHTICIFYLQRTYERPNCFHLDFLKEKVIHEIGSYSYRIPGKWGHVQIQIGMPAKSWMQRRIASAKIMLQLEVFILVPN